jgi:hypothetical protein
MDFSFSKFLEGTETAVQIPAITTATGKDHNDVHYLYRLRKATGLLVGEENMKGYSASQLQVMHVAIVRGLIASGINHWFDTYDSDLDESLPMDLKLVSSGFDPPKDESIFGLEEDEMAIRAILEDNDLLYFWTAPTARAKVPANHFLDQKNKKYPYKDSKGSVNCGGLMAAYKAARGARGAPKRPEVAAKAKRLLTAHCGKSVKEKKASESVYGKLVRL